jgi:hypothetical protein
MRPPRALPAVLALAIAACGTDGSSSTGPSTSDVARWNEAYSWGDHAAAGYLESESDPVFAASAAHGVGASDIANWNAAYGWGDHATAGYQLRVAGSCSSGNAIRAVSSDGSVSCQPVGSYSAGSGLALSGGTFSVARGGIDGTMVAPGAIAIPQLSTFTAGIVSSTTDVTVRSHYVATSGGVSSARVVISTGGLACGGSGCGTGVVTIVVNGSPLTAFNVGGDGNAPWTYVSPSFALGNGTTMSVLARATNAASPVWIRDLTVEWGH